MVKSLEERPLSFEELVADKGQLVAEDLLLGLRDGRAMVRANAALGLAALGHTGPDLIPFLRDSHPVAAHAAGEAIGHLGLAQRAHLVAIGAALDGARREVVDLVVSMFASLVGKADGELIDVLDTSDSIAAAAVVEACGRAGLRGLQLLHAAATKDHRARVRLHAVRGVGKLAHMEPVASVDVMRTVAGEDEVSDVRAAARVAMVAYLARTRGEAAARKRGAQAAPAAVPALLLRALTPDELRAAATVAPQDELLAALADRRLEARLNAVRVLGLQGAAAASAATSIAIATRDPDASVRVDGVRALGALGVAAVVATPALVRALGDADPAVVGAAEGVLAELGAAARPALLDGLEVPDEAHGARIAALIGRLADGPATLRDALASTSVDARVNAALGLGALGPARAGAVLPALFAATRGGNARVRAAVTRAIEAIEPRPDASLPPIAIDGFEDRALTEADVGKHKDTLVAVGVAGLAPRLADPRPAVRANTALALGVLGDGPGVVDALAVCLRDDDASVRAAAVRAVARLGDGAIAASAPELVRALGGADPALATQLATMLRATGQPAIAAALVVGLDANDGRQIARLLEIVTARADAADLLAQAFARPGAQDNAAHGFVMLGKDRLGPARALLERARVDISAYVRELARTTLVAIDGPPPALAPIAIDGFEDRALTEADLGKRKDVLAAAGVAGLVARLADTRAVVRANTVLALGVLGDAPGVAGALAAGLRDDDGAVRAAAARALAAAGDGAVAAVADDVVRALASAAGLLATQLATMLRAAGQPAIAAALVRGLDAADAQLVARLLDVVTARPDAVDLLCEAFARPGAQATAARGFVMLGKDELGMGRALLARARTDLSAAVRDLARATLLAIDGPGGPPPLPPLAIDGFEDRVLAEADLAKRKDAVLAAGVAGLGPRLADARAVVRANAALALGVHGDAPGVVETLAVCLRDDDADVRLAAARAIARLGDDAVGASAADLVPTLGGLDAALAAQAATMLRSHAHPAIAAALIRGLDTTDAHQAAQVREVVCARPDAVELLCEAFARPGAQAGVARGFVMLGKDRLGRGRALLEAGRIDSAARVRALAQATLLAIDGPPAMPTVPAVPGFETELLDGKAFAAAPIKGADAVVSFLIDGRAVVRANAATALGTLGAAAAGRALTIAALLRDDDDRVRVAAARALDKLGDDAVVAAAPYLVAALGGSAGVADVCHGVLASRAALVEAALIAGLETSDEVHGMRVADLICTRPGARELLFAAFDGEAQNVQINAAFGIGKLGLKKAGAEGRARLLSGLPGPPTRRRAAMVKALAMLEPDRPVR